MPSLPQLVTKTTHEGNFSFKATEFLKLSELIWSASIATETLRSRAPGTGRRTSTASGIDGVNADGGPTEHKGTKRERRDEKAARQFTLKLLGDRKGTTSIYFVRTESLSECFQVRSSRAAIQAYTYLQWLDALDSLRDKTMPEPVPTQTTPRGEGHDVLGMYLPVFQ